LVFYEAGLLTDPDRPPPPPPLSISMGVARPGLEHLTPSVRALGKGKGKLVSGKGRRAPPARSPHYALSMPADMAEEAAAERAEAEAWEVDEATQHEHELLEAYADLDRQQTGRRQPKAPG